MQQVMEHQLVADYPQAESRYAHMSKSELISALEAHDRTLQGIYDVIHLPNTKMAPGEKLFWIGARCILPQERPNADGLVRLPHDKVATFIGMSDSTANRYGNALIERFDATKVPVPYTTKKKQKRELTYVNRDEPVWQEPWNVDLPEEKERVINGNGKECPRCKTFNLQITTHRITYQEVQECDCCGYKKVSAILDDKKPLDPGEYVPEKKGPQAGEPFADEEEKAQKTAPLPNPITPGQAEKGLQPEEPFGIESWLGKRIGEHIDGEKRIIVATGILEDDQKYYYKEEDYQPDIARYLAGDPEHIYGSRMYRTDGSTWFLTGDFDDKHPEHDRDHVAHMTTLAHAGIASLYSQRRPGRGHLDILFSAPIDSRAAREWVISLCPELATAEWFPNGKQPVSWPFYQRIGDVVTECKVEVMYPAAPGHLYASKGITSEPEKLVELLRRCMTDASLVPPLKVEETRPYARGLLEKPLPMSAWEDDLIEAFNRSHSWGEIAVMCGGWSSRGYFKAVWRCERTASVKPDADGRYACDYGNHGNFPKKLDKYGAWCLIENIDPVTDLKARRAAMREAVSV